MNGWITTGLVLAAAVASVWATHSYDAAQHRATVADLRAEAATTLADQTAIVLGLLQEQIDQNKQLEEDYTRADAARLKLVEDGQRLSHDLDRTVERLRALTRESGDGGGGAEDQTDSGADRCAPVRAALAGALGAVELLERAGDEIAELGQHAVDVATVAAKDARQRETSR